MKNILISDEEEDIYLFSGKILKESDIDLLENIIGRLLDKIAKLERNAPPPEGTRLNILEYSHDTLWKAQVEAKKILEEMKVEIARISRKFDHDHKAYTRIYKELDEHTEIIDRIQEGNYQRMETNMKRDKRISDIEKFLGDI